MMEPKRCPVCNHMAVLKHRNESVYVECDRCGLRGPFFTAFPKFAVAEWNKLRREEETNEVPTVPEGD